MQDIQQRLRQLPQISVLLGDPSIRDLLRGRRQGWVTRLVQEVVGDLRLELQEAEGPVRSRDELTAEALARIHYIYEEMLTPAWTRVLNGTGVVVHTNLGRSNLAAEAVAAMAAAAGANCDLEYDLAQGRRGHRGRRVEAKAALLAGAQDALIVNNNAAAVWLAVRFLAAAGPVLLSRGEVVAIGGSFRMNDILAETGCELVEVGTTNRTSLHDYAEVMTPGCTVLKVHRSNFTVEGFTEEVSLAELAALCREKQAHLVYDAGSGAFYPYAEFGLPAGEKQLGEDVETGADLVTCSGDKLLGACQAGIIFGSREMVEGLRSHPMRRAFRVDKTTLAALDSVLTTYLRAVALPAVPTIEVMAQSEAVLQKRAEELLSKLKAHAPSSWHGKVVPGNSSVGGGSFSNCSVPSRLVLWEAPKGELEACNTLLRKGDPALLGRMNQDGLALDIRTIFAAEETLVIEAFQKAWEQI